MFAMLIKLLQITCSTLPRPTLSSSLRSLQISCRRTWEQVSRHGNNEFVLFAKVNVMVKVKVMVMVKVKVKVRVKVMVKVIVKLIDPPAGRSAPRR